MAGYSGTPLPKKLGIKGGTRVVLRNVPPAVRAELAEPLTSCHVLPASKPPVDFALLSVLSRSELKKEFAALAKHLAPAGILWVSWPKKTSGVTTDLNENEVRRIGLELGLVDVKVCAVDETWSGLKFVIRLKDRSKVN
jgi:hypothetical protein